MMVTYQQEHKQARAMEPKRHGYVLEENVKQ